MAAETRTVVTRSGARIRGYFASQKCHDLIEWESFLERDFLYVQEFLYWIGRFRAYQRLIVVHGDGGAFNAYPDFLVVDTNKEQAIVEVKSNHDLANPAVADRLSAINFHLERQGVLYDVWTETQIRKQPRFTNIKQLLPLRRPGARGVLQAHKLFRELRAQDREYTMQEITDRAGDSQLPLQLLANDLLHFDLDSSLTPTTSVRLH